ncbi:MAG: LPXTG cell wall anchor domain-containing protein [Gammaproteobacteria bacterium]
MLSATMRVMVSVGPPAAPAATSATSAPALPRTGTDAAITALGGGALLLAGLGLRRRTADAAGR